MKSKEMLKTKSFNLEKPKKSDGWAKLVEWNRRWNKILSVIFGILCFSLLFAIVLANILHADYRNYDVVTTTTTTTTTRRPTTSSTTTTTEPEITTATEAWTTTTTTFYPETTTEDWTTTTTQMMTSTDLPATTVGPIEETTTDMVSTSSVPPSFTTTPTTTETGPPIPEPEPTTTTSTPGTTVSTPTPVTLDKEPTLPTIPIVTTSALTNPGSEATSMGIIPDLHIKCSNLLTTCELEYCVITKCGVTCIDGYGYETVLSSIIKYMADFLKCKEIDVIINNCDFTSNTLKEKWLDVGKKVRSIDLNVKLERIESGAFTSSIFDETAMITISNSLITKLDSSVFLGLSNLETLSFNGGKFLEVTADAFSQLPKLKTLNLDLNVYPILLTNITGSTIYPSMESVSLRYNELSYIPSQSFTGLPNLMSLYLSSSRIIWIAQDAFSGASDRLLQLHLDGNVLTTVEPGTFTGVLQRDVVRVYLADNPWKCDCSAGMLELQDQMTSFDTMNKFPGEVVCATPAYNNNVTIGEASLCSTPSTTPEPTTTTTEMTTTTTESTTTTTTTPVTTTTPPETTTTTTTTTETTTDDGTTTTINTDPPIVINTPYVSTTPTAVVTPSTNTTTSKRYDPTPSSTTEDEDDDDDETTTSPSSTRSPSDIVSTRVPNTYFSYSCPNFYPGFIFTQLHIKFEGGHRFNLTEVDVGAVWVRIEQNCDEHVLFWFENRYLSFDPYTEYKPALTCMAFIREPLVIKHLETETIYTFCMILPTQSTLSPFDCLSISLSPAQSEQTWLKKKDQLMIYLVIGISFIFSFLVGSFLTCLCVRKNPRILGGITRTFIETKKTTHKDIKMNPPLPKRNATHQKKKPLQRSVSDTSLASVRSYVSAIHPSPFEIIAWKMDRTRYTAQQSFYNLEKMPDFPPPIPPPKRRSDTSHYSNLDEIYHNHKSRRTSTEHVSNHYFNYRV